ncbi:MAG: ATP synthase gamma chain [Fimbriimonadales bacterium]|nr:MAG: ATP synthase gamma chain [Fimbriimonadales bacterium]
MATLKQLRQRIRSAKSIQQITRAMKLVAAARLLKAQERATKARPYAEGMRTLMANLATMGDMPDHPLLQRRDVARYILVPMTAERGLCGSFNTNLIRKAHDFIRSRPETAEIVSVGKKGQQYFQKRGFPVLHHLSLPTAGPTIEHARELTNFLVDRFVSGETDAVFLAFSRFHSAIRQTPEVVQLLPIEPPEAEDVGGEGFHRAYTFEPEPTELLAQLLPRYALTVVFQALLESNASEHGARMTAMTSATDNAGEMIRMLTLQANRQRQASITKEILEIVAGAEALKG